MSAGTDNAERRRTQSRATETGRRMALVPGFVRARMTWEDLTMALLLRPNCEYRDKDLPPDAADARICS